jgi:PAS domain S-box-containing protein
MGDDIDLNEIFADYFINEFDDPLNAYTNSMANYNGAAAAVALAQKQQQVDAAQAAAPTQTLPTGGIRTAFHTAAAAPATGNGVEPNPKRIKMVPVGSQQRQPNVPAIPGAPVIGKGAISGRLGFSMVGGQLALPHQQQLQAQQQQQVQQQQQPGLPQPAPAKQAAASTGVALPVGVGIRLGGIGGVAPSMAQAAPRAGHFMMWGGPGGMGGAPGEAAGAMSEHAIAERRQRNREHAKRSRVRKKFMLESLQEQVRGLQKENTELRMLIQEKVPQHAQSIIAECCSKNSLFSDPTGAGDSATDAKPGRKETSLEKSDYSLIESLTSGQQNFVLSDPRLPDNPIVYASPGFYVLTGYTQDQVLGRNCRFLQGPGTDPRAVDIIRTAIANGSDATTCILNYKADGTPFWNQFFVAALRDSDNCIVNYVSVLCYCAVSLCGTVYF